ncbi:hypothetical protein [Umezawaea sp. Da 62-37]|uniref:hypothetical protein n=1 Tax=Umezawaea sp. Da 62-37 TaxID=3075927 RepID=UPI0028F73F9F|nr:hypothetical protein [Umezawaea sp. Da 62-37]WNV85254.1 hypothetical protein RM788_45240 [Umezawaea sp. Da 62-37]
MDHVNRFESRTTYLLLRAEYAVALVVCSVLFLLHIGEVRWVQAVALFVYIDVIGYIPGAIAYRRARNGGIPKVYYVLYNTMHSFVTQAAVVAVWVAVAGFEWALLAVPIHLCGDRAIFGNFLKPFRVPFEPVALPAFVEFDRRTVMRDSADLLSSEPK